jgi:hypothetical protein
MPRRCPRSFQELDIAVRKSRHVVVIRDVGDAASPSAAESLLMSDWEFRLDLQRINVAAMVLGRRAVFAEDVRDPPACCVRRVAPRRREHRSRRRSRTRAGPDDPSRPQLASPPGGAR